MTAQTTCWTVIRGAAAGDGAQRQLFARRYEDVVRAYLVARWRRSPLLQEVEDALQEVFVESFREGGVLAKADPEFPGGFRAFFYGVVRNVAMRFEARQGRRRDRQPATDFLQESPGGRDEGLSRVFDRAWARSVMIEAAERQRQRAEAERGGALARVELLRLRFHEGLPIREIARLWNDDPVRLHREYARARKEFRAALAEVIAAYQPGSSEAAIDSHCASLLSLLK